MKQVAKQVDAIVAPFTRKILNLARKQGVDFAYAGAKNTPKAEINKVMSINVKAVRDLLK